MFAVCHHFFWLRGTTESKDLNDVTALDWYYREDLGKNVAVPTPTSPACLC